MRNLPYACTEAELSELFGAYGGVAEAHLVLDRQTKKSKVIGVWATHPGCLSC